MKYYSAEFAEKIISILSKTYAKAGIELTFENTFQLLVATILSAQSTDKQVNKVTPVLFKKYPTILSLAKSDISELKRIIFSTGFYNNKAKNIRACANEIIERFDGKVPSNMDELITLPGVARKTANVVLFNAFGKNSGIAVDTHVMRLSQRIGLSKNDSPTKIELDLMKILPNKIWGKLTYYLIEHGRHICDAKKPKCPICPVAKFCKYYLSLNRSK